MAPELRELAELREDAAGLAAAFAQARWRRAAGLPPQEPLRDVLKAHRLAASAEGLAQAVEALEEAQRADPRKPARVARLSALRDLLARARALELEPSAAQELFDLPQRPLVRPPGDAGLHGAMPAVVVWRELPFLAARERRAAMDAALATALQPADAVRGAAWDAALDAQEEANLPVAGDAESWANALLDGTDALAKDLGGWLLERHTGATFGNAARHDVLHLVHAPRFASAFPAGEAERTVRRWAEMLRLDLSALKIDSEDRPLKWPGAHAEPLDPPFEAAISFLPQAGPRAPASLLAAIGVALLRLGPPEEAPPEDLWLGEKAMQSACAALLEGLGREPQWLRRCAKVDLSRDDERAIAVAAVLDARTDAAQVLAAVVARDSGLGARAASAHRDLYLRATGAELPLGLALCDIDPWVDALARLKGRALAARIAVFLRERFDEDWWRNPRSTSSLRGLWQRGGRQTCAELWTELGAEPALDPLLLEFSEECG